MFDELKRYKEEHRHCNVRTDTRYKEHPQPKLAAWLNKQRKLQKEGRLRADRKARLDELKFIWDTLEAAWETMFNEATKHASIRLGLIGTLGQTSAVPQRSSNHLASSSPTASGQGCGCRPKPSPGGGAGAAKARQVSSCWRRCQALIPSAFLIS
jgi:hypothetical protein